MPNPDDTLAEIDEAIDDYVTWYGGGDAATWSAGDVPGRDVAWWDRVAQPSEPERSAGLLPVVRDPEEVGTYNHGEDCRCGEPGCVSSRTRQYASMEAAIASACSCRICAARRSGARARYIEDERTGRRDVAELTTAVTAELRRVHQLHRIYWVAEHDAPANCDVVRVRFEEPITARGVWLVYRVEESAVSAGGARYVDSVFVPIKVLTDRGPYSLEGYPPRDTLVLHFPTHSVGSLMSDPASAVAAEDVTTDRIQIRLDQLRICQLEERYVPLCQTAQESPVTAPHRIEGSRRGGVTPQLVVYDEWQRQQVAGVEVVSYDHQRATYELRLAGRRTEHIEVSAEVLESLGYFATRNSMAYSIEQGGEAVEALETPVAGSLHQPHRPGVTGQQSTYGPPQRGRRR